MAASQEGFGLGYYSTGSHREGSHPEREVGQERLEHLRATHRCFTTLLRETEELGGIVYPGSARTGGLVFGEFDLIGLRMDNSVYMNSLDELTSLLLQDAPLQYDEQQRDAFQLAMVYGILGPGWETRKTDSRVLYAQHHFDTARSAALKGADWLTIAVLLTHDVVEDRVKEVMHQRFSSEKPGKSLYELPEREQRVYRQQTKDLIHEWLEAIGRDFYNNVWEEHLGKIEGDYDYEPTTNRGVESLRQLPYVLDLMTRPWHVDYVTYFLRLYNTKKRWDGVDGGDNVCPDYLYALDRRGYSNHVFARAQMAKPLDRADNTATLLGYGLPQGVTLCDALTDAGGKKAKPIAPARQVLNGFKNLVFLTEALRHYAHRVPTEATSVVALDPEGPYYAELLRTTQDSLAAFASEVAPRLGFLGFVRRPVYHRTLREYESRGGLDRLTQPGEIRFPWWQPLEARIGRYFDARVIEYAVLARDIARETPSTKSEQQLYKDAIVFLRMAEKIEQEERFYRPQLYVPRDQVVAHLRSSQGSG